MATKQDVQDALDAAALLLAAVSTGGYTPLVRPTPVDCLGGTIPNAITIVAGDGAPGGEMADPYRARRMNNMPNGIVGIFGDSILQATHETLISPFAVNFALGGQSLRRTINSLRYGFPCMHTAGAGVLQVPVNDISNTTYYGPRTNHSATQTVLGMFRNQLRNYLTGRWVIAHALPIGLVVSGATVEGHTYTAQEASDRATMAPLYNAQVSEMNSKVAAMLSGAAWPILDENGVVIETQAAVSACPATIEFVPVNPEFFDGNGLLKSMYHIGDGQHLNKAGSALLAAGIYQALVNLGIQ